MSGTLGEGGSARPASTDPAGGRAHTHKPPRHPLPANWRYPRAGWREYPGHQLVEPNTVSVSNGDSPARPLRTGLGRCGGGTFYGHCVSLLGALDDPSTLLRRFVELSFPQGTDQLRREHRDRLAGRAITVPNPGIRGLAGVVGQAFDMRLRLAFTTNPPVPRTVEIGIAVLEDQAIRAEQTAEQATTAAQAEQLTQRAALSAAVARTGRDLADRITAMVGDLDLDNRSTRLRRRSQEAHLARLLIAAAWYEIAYRNPFGGFARTPIGQQTDPRFTLRRLLHLVPTEAIDDLTALVAAASRGPAHQLRATTTPETCAAGPTFAGSADVGAAEADLIAGGVLVDIKTTANPWDFPARLIHQLLGYTLLDYHDTYRIREIGIYHARIPALITWPLEHALQKMGATADLATLRARCQHLGQAAELDAPIRTPRGEDAAALLLAEAGLSPARRCRICGTPLPPPRPGGQRRYCSPPCRRRAAAARRSKPLHPSRSPIVLLSPP